MHHRYHPNASTFCPWLLGLGLLLMPLAARAQGVGIGTTAPDNSALLELRSTTKGLLPPRLTQQQRDAIGTPANGLLVYQTNNSPGLYQYQTGPGWVRVGTDNLGDHTATQNLDLGSNKLVSGTGTQGLGISSAGYVGLGAGTANTRLSISPGTTEPKITLYDGGSTSAHYGFGISSGQLNYHVSGASADHVFYAGGRNGAGTGVAELLRIGGDGKVGIGTAAPAQLLDVSGPAATATVNTAPLLRLSRPATSGVKYAHAAELHLGSYGTSIGSQSQLDFRLNNGNTNNPDRTVLTLLGNGNVGVGTAEPGARLHVSGGGVRLDGTNTLELGGDVDGKQADAGKIGYQRFTTDALDIVGAGTSGTNRKIKLWAEGGLTVAGLNGTGTRTVVADAAGRLSTVASTTASNGLSLTGTDVRLGGSLAANTTVALNDKTLALTQTRPPVMGNVLSVDIAPNGGACYPHNSNGFLTLRYPGQTFKPTTTGPVSQIVIQFSKWYTNTLTMYLVSGTYTANAQPTQVLATATYTTTQNGYQWGTFVFPTPATVTAGQTYTVVVDCGIMSPTYSNYAAGVWFYGDDVYAAGEATDLNNSSAADRMCPYTAADHYMRVYYRGIVTSPASATFGQGKLTLSSDAAATVLDAQGSVTVGGDLTVTGTTNLGQATLNAPTITGGGTVDGNLVVNGSSALNGQVTVGTGLQVGSGGSTVSKILRQTYASVALGTIGAQDHLDRTFTLTGAEPGATVLVSADGGLTRGVVVATAWVSATNQVTVRLSNMRGSQNGGTASFFVTVIQ